MAKQVAWIGVDLDGTLAHYDGWKDIQHIGKPIPKMVARVKKWLANGQEVRIFTARVSVEEYREAVTKVIEQWCLTHIGQKLPVTCVKDLSMIQLWDDRAVQVVANTGVRADGGP